MAFPQPQQQITPRKRNTYNLYYTPSPTNASFGYLSISTQRIILYTVTPSTPRVSLPSPSFTRDAKPIAEAVHEEKTSVVEDKVSVIGFVDWTAEGRWWIDSDVKRTGYVEYPTSCERSSIVREAQHKRNAELEIEKRRRL